MLKSYSRLHAPVLLFAIVASLMTPFLQPPTPAHAWPQQTWDTKAAFDLGALNNTDTSSSPNNVLLATNLDTGDGSDGALTVKGTDTDIINKTATALSSTSYIGSSYIKVNSTAGFAVGKEVLIIQMTGTGAGTWETIYIAGVESTTNILVFAAPLKYAYYADANSKAQVIQVPHYTDVTINPGGVLICMPWLWDGQTGGVIFFRAKGTVTVNPGGLIEASGMGFQGGSGGSTGGGGAGGSGGYAGGSSFHTPPNGGPGGSTGTGGGAGDGGESSSSNYGYPGGDGGLQGNAGFQQSGQSGAGPGGGTPNQGGTNPSSADMSLMQIGGGGGGGGGLGGTGAGGGGGGGSNTAEAWSQPAAGQSGGSGGSAGAGGIGGNGGGMIIITAASIVGNQSGLVLARGQGGA
ncbi:MAG: hypothetical protein NTY79_03455, partial [Chloroflexi bacterium]|nr:hypothetical protein [Chloroflexota bacterium]